MNIEIRFTLVDNEKLLLANLYALTSINKRLKKKLFSSATWESDYGSKPMFWLIIEGVRELLDVSHNTH